MAQSKFIHPLWGLFALVVVGFPVGVLCWPDPPPPQRYGELPNFSLLDQTGAPFERWDMTGGVWVADFIFTRCPEICPLLSTRMAQLQDLVLAHDSGGPPIGLVSITVDPRHDTPAVLAEYGSKFSADPSVWSFLTGSENDIQLRSE